MRDYYFAGSIANSMELKEDEEAVMVVSTDGDQPFREDGLGCSRGILAGVVLQTIVVCAGLICWGLYSFLG